MVFIMFLLHELWWVFYEKSGSAYEPEVFVNMVSAMDLENVLKFPIAKKNYRSINSLFITFYKKKPLQYDIETVFLKTN